MNESSLEHVPNEELHLTVRRLTACANVALADLLTHLGEVERRGIHRDRACASLYTYCIYELRMSEDAAFRRAKAARIVRRYPELREAIANGEIHLTGVLMIGPHLGGERHAEVLERARFRSKRELLRLIAELDPRPPVPALVEPLGPPPAGRATHSVHIESLMGPVRELLAGARPADWFAENEQETSTADVSAVDGSTAEVSAADGSTAEVSAADGSATDAQAADERAAHVRSASDTHSRFTARALQYKVQFTASQRYVDLPEEALALLSHEEPRPGLPDVQLRALELFVVKLRKERRGGSAALKANESENPTSLERLSRPAGDDAHTEGAVLERLSRPADDELDPDGAAPERVSRPADDELDADVAAPERVSRPADDELDPDVAASERVSRPVDDELDADVAAPERMSRPPNGKSRGRHVSRSVQRTVWDRDGARCAYVDARGVRCRETTGLEIHHRKAYALAGPNTPENLELRCTSHNALAAEEDFGREHLDCVRPCGLRIEA